MTLLFIVLGTVNIQKKILRFISYVGYFFMNPAIDLYLKVELVV
jgi:hypothetical protein